MTRLTSNEIFSPSKKIHWEVGRAKDLSAPRYYRHFEPIFKDQAVLKCLVNMLT